MPLNFSSLLTDLPAFSALVLDKVEQKNRLITSGIVARSPELDDFCNGGTALEGVAVRMIREQSWGAARLPDSMTLLDLADHIAGYESRRLTSAVMAILCGIFAENEASTGGSTINDFQSALTTDVSGENFIPGVTQFTIANLEAARTIIEAAQPFNDQFKVLAVHSAVHSRLVKNGFVSDADPLLCGMSVIFDDSMPKIGNVYDSYLFHKGALEIGRGNVKGKGTVVTTYGDAGEEMLKRLWSTGIRVHGYAFKGTSAGGGPVNETLAHADSWRSTGPVKIVRLRTREA